MTPNPRDVDRYDEIYAAYRWDVPGNFNIASACCSRHASQSSSIALYWEDESGATSSHTFEQLQADANRLSNGLTQLGIGKGDRVAIILPQCPQTVIAHIACYQLGAITVPLSFLFGPEALEFRLQDSEAKLALVDSGSIAQLETMRAQLPNLNAVIAVGAARESWALGWDAFLAKARDRSPRWVREAPTPRY